jgi:hypothetical protein
MAHGVHGTRCYMAHGATWHTVLHGTRCTWHTVYMAHGATWHTVLGYTWAYYKCLFWTTWVETKMYFQNFCNQS